MGSKKKEEKLKEVRGVYRSGTTAVSARAASLSQAVDSLLKGFEKKGLLLRNPPQIRHYLMEFPRLVRLLPQIIESVRRHFPRTPLCLECYQDPEMDDRYLALYLRFPRYKESLLERIHATEAEFRKDLAEKDGWIQLMVDFQEG